MSNVFSIVASATGYTNVDVSGADIPLTNASGTTPGPLNPNMYVPFLAPNTSAVGAGGGAVFTATGLNTNMTAANAPAPVNLTALNETVPSSGPPTGNGTSTGVGSSASAKPSGARKEVMVAGATVLGFVGALSVVVALSV